MRRQTVSTAALLVVPLAVGGVLSGVWWLVDQERTLITVLPLHLVPLVAALMVTGVGAVVVLTAVICGHRARAGRRRIVQDMTASRHRLVARLDHEIKNPIQGIRAALADEPSARQRASIDAQSRRLVALLRDLRKIGEVEHMPLELTTLDAAALAREAVAAVTDIPEAQERRWEVTFPTAPRPLPAVRADEDLMFLALVNVLTNAVKYSGEGDAIEVRGRLDDPWLVIEIADTGQGIAADELELVWEELGRSREARGIEGSGLGLPMVRAILERHGGRADLGSWAGEGSTVSLRIPVAGPGGGR